MYLRLLLKRKQPPAFLCMIPYIFTLLNAFFGFLSIIKSLENDFTTAAYFMLLAALMDGLDGRLARTLGSTSYFGQELDSLCDAISFCLAPTVLLYCWFPGNFSRIGVCILGIYVCAGVWRLARFNVNTTKTVSAYFTGLPTTLAAFFIASFILYAPWLATHSGNFLFSHKALCLMVFTLAALMVSSIPFTTLKRYKITSVYEAIKCGLFSIFMIWCTIYHYPCFLFLITGYIGYNSLYFFTQAVVK
ncbi:MAG: CDP-diacylglycerol--serine O-phosphatidyltransferase [Candidatus Babeliaceae bacterium]